MRLVPLLILVGATCGCPVVSHVNQWMDPTTSVGPMRAAHERLVEDTAISKLLERESTALLSDPKRLELRGTNVGVALVSLGREPGPGETPPEATIGSYRGNRRLDPGKIAALPLGAYYYANCEMPRLRDDPRLRFVIPEMLARRDIGDINSAIDRLTETESGPPLEVHAVEEFRAKRGTIDEWLERVGLNPPLSVYLKLWATAPRGRDVQLLGSDYAAANVATAESLARLAVIAAERLLDLDGEGRLLKALRIERSRPGALESHALAGRLPPSWPVAAIASTHDDAYGDLAIFTIPGGARFVVVVLTDRAKSGREFADRIAEKIVAAILAGDIAVPSPGSAK